MPVALSSFEVVDVWVTRKSMLPPLFVSFGSFSVISIVFKTCTELPSPHFMGFPTKSGILHGATAQPNTINNRPFITLKPRSASTSALSLLAAFPAPLPIVMDYYAPAVCPSWLQTFGECLRRHRSHCLKVTYGTVNVPPTPSFQSTPSNSTLHYCNTFYTWMFSPSLHTKGKTGHLLRNESIDLGSPRLRVGRPHLVSSLLQ